MTGRYGGEVVPEFLDTLVSFGFDEVRAREALLRSGNVSVEAALDWMDENPEKAASAATAPAAPSGGTAGASAAPTAGGEGEEEDDDDDDDAAVLAAALKRKLRAAGSAAAAAAAAAPAAAAVPAADGGAAGGAAGSPGGAPATSAAALTAEEARARAEDLQRKLREARLAREKREQLEREKNRLESTKKALETQRMLEEAERKRELERVEKEKEDVRREKTRLREQLKRDYEERFGKPYPEDGVHDGSGQKKLDMPAAISSLGKRRTATNTAEYAACVRTLRAYFDNVVKDPTNPKFSRIRIENAAFQAKVKPFFPEALQALTAGGFVQSSDGAFLEIAGTTPNSTVLAQGVRLLDFLLKQI